MSKAALKSFIIISLLISFAIAQLRADDEISTATTADGRPIYMVPLIAAGVRIDGVLDEEAWENALLLELNYEVMPGENIEPPVRTEVLLAYDESHLYIAFRAFDTDPTAIRAHLSDRDSFMNDDHVGVVFDTYNDEIRGFAFYCNPLGVQWDQTESDAGAHFSNDMSWDAIWDSKGRIYDWGYAVEFAIPFTSLRFQRSDGDQIWGLDVIRWYPRSVARRITIFPRDRNRNCYLCQFHKISGFKEASPGRNLEIAPTVTAVRTDERDELPGGDFERVNQVAEFGVTTRWGITPNLTLSATANPDFSQVEADAIRLDVNEPFALYFPERRPFFTEGADFFSTGLDAVYTRTMRDPSWGLKLTGKEGPNAIGAYFVRDEVTNLIFPGSEGSDSTSLSMANSSSVFRYRRDVGRNSTIGLLATDREAGDYYNRVFGADGNFRPTSNDTIMFQFLASATRYDDATADEFGQPMGGFSGSAYNIRYEHATRNWFAYSMYRSFDADFRADLGFIPRTGYRWYVFGSERIWWGDSDDFFTNLKIGMEWDEMYNIGGDGNLIFREFETWFQYQGPLQSFFSIRGGRARENYQGFSMVQNFLNVSFHFQPTGYLHFGIGGWRPGDCIDYEHARGAFRNTIGPWANISIGRHLNLYLQHRITSLTVGGERLFLANLSEARIRYQFNLRTFFRVVLQYSDIRRNTDLYKDVVDRRSNNLFTQLLFSYKINPQTVLFIGYSDNYFGTQDYRLVQADRTFFVKLGYAWVL